MGILQQRGTSPFGDGHDGEVLCCTYSPDGAFLLSGGWDGYLRLWETSTGAVVQAIQVGTKPISACALRPDGGEWVSGSMDGMMGFWDVVTHKPRLHFLAHMRPISGICYSADGQTLATTSWDRQIAFRTLGAEAECRSVQGHEDVIGGCVFQVGGNQLITWSNDGSVRIWQMGLGRELATYHSHLGRGVTTANRSPDGRWLVAGGREGQVTVWDLVSQEKVGRTRWTREIRGCYFLYDTSLLLVVDAQGDVVIHTVPDFGVVAELQTGVPTQSVALSPSLAELTLGSVEGRIYRIGVEGFEPQVLRVLPVEQQVPRHGLFGRVLGKPHMETTYEYLCPRCGTQGHQPLLSEKQFHCKKCRQHLHLEQEFVVSGADAVLGV